MGALVGRPATGPMPISPVVLPPAVGPTDQLLLDLETAVDGSGIVILPWGPEARHRASVPHGGEITVTWDRVLGVALQGEEPW